MCDRRSPPASCRPRRAPPPWPHPRCSVSLVSRPFVFTVPGLQLLVGLPVLVDSFCAVAFRACLGPLLWAPQGAAFPGLTPRSRLGSLFPLPTVSLVPEARAIDT